ncbi:MAG TPA: exodeoxyribonuclease VII small subunit [Phycisphaerae bacterium]|nr:exodeoxyribonuclease VII small subunit [Phycisphaerae bacterium]
MVKKDEKQISFEQAMTQLEKIVSQIASGQIGLEESLAMYEKGMELVQRCRTILDRAEKRIEMLSQSNGGLSAEPMNSSSEDQDE